MSGVARPANGRRSPARRRTAFAGCLALAVLIASCAEPASVVDEAAESLEVDEVVDEPPVDLGPLEVQIDHLQITLDAAVDALQGAAEADDVTAARSAGVLALHYLIDGEERPATAAATTDGRIAGLLPSAAGDRSVTDDDPALMITALDAARSTPTPLGDEVRAVLVDVVAGDLGGWQRDPAGMLAWAREVADPGHPLEALEPAVWELPGEALRAVAWAMLLTDAQQLDDAHQFAERAAAHVGLISLALASALDAAASTSS